MTLLKSLLIGSHLIGLLFLNVMNVPKGVEVTHDLPASSVVGSEHWVYVTIEKKKVRKASNAGHRSPYSLMSSDFHRPVDMTNQLATAQILFGRSVAFRPDDLEKIKAWISDAESSNDNANINSANIAATPIPNLRAPRCQ